MSHLSSRHVASLAATALASASLALSQAASPAPMPQQGRDARGDGRQTSAMPPSAAAREQDAAFIDRDVQVPISQTPPGTMGGDVQVPIGQATTVAAPLPPGAGYNNPGGAVDSAALAQQAGGGVHYHYHYYGPGTFTTAGNPGYAPARFASPASGGGGGGWNRFMTAPIGPGNPAPMNTLAGEYQNSVNPAVWRGPAPNPELVGGGMSGDGGQAWSYGGDVGDWNPFAFGGNGYITGFND